MKRIKKGGLNVQLIDLHALNIGEGITSGNTTSPHGVYSECKVNWFCTCTQESDRQRINKRQEHKEEAAATGIIIARIC